MPYIKGLDCSSVQGALPWDKLDDIRFVIAKCTQGNDGKDPWCERTVKEARARGKAAFRYYFVYPLAHIDPKVQAQTFFKDSNGDGPPFLDLEWPAPQDWGKWKCSPQQISDWYAALLEEVEAEWGCPAFSYLYPWWNECLEHGAPAYGFPTGADTSGWARGRQMWLPKYLNKWPSGDWTAPGLDPFDSAPFVQVDGDGGLKLPDGRDCDFDIFCGTEDELFALERKT